MNGIAVKTDGLMDIQSSTWKIRRTFVDVHNMLNGADGFRWEGDDAFRLITLQAFPTIALSFVSHICFQRLASQFCNCPGGVEHYPERSPSGLCDFAFPEVPLSI